MYNRDSKIMRKLLGKAAPDSTTGNLSSISGTATPIPSSYRPSKSQDAGYSAGVPISCFDVSSDRRAVILAGPHILKTVVRDDTATRNFVFKDGIDVRKAIVIRHSNGYRANEGDDQLNIRDVKWHSGYQIFTACASGKVFSYDLTRLAAGEVEPLAYNIMMHEDSRQINSLAINPHLQTWLLTGGQDGTARVFDIRAMMPARHGMTFRQRFAPLRCLDPIRQVSWSPTQGHEMACCTDGGIIMKWDVRHPSRPVIRFNAHEKACSSIAWHPDGVHVISAGWDTKIQVWDLGPTADKRQRPKFTISAPASVAAVAWRPGLWSARSQARRVAQIAVTYDETGSRRYGTPAVHVWDFARPLMPYKEIESFQSSPSALWWQDQDLLWTAGPDGAFTQRDVAFARKATDRQSTSTVAFSARGDAMMFLDERWHSNRLRFHETHATDMILQGAMYGSSPGNPGLSLSRSDSDDDFLGGFLGPRRRTTRKREPSSRGGVSLSTTPPSGGEASFPDDAKQDLDLDQSINVTGMFKAHQAMTFGHIPAAVNVQLYQFMSSAYLETLKKGLPYVEGGKCMVERVGDMLEQFAQASEAANLYRLAQTWRILAYAMSVLLKRRAQYHFEVRVGQLQSMHPDDASHEGSHEGSHDGSPQRPDRSKASEMSGDNGGGDTPRDSTAQRSSVDGRFHSLRSLLAAEIENTSNMPTPVARPADNSSGGSNVNDANKPNLNTSDFGREETVHAQGKKRLSPIMEPRISQLSLRSATHGSPKESSKSSSERLDSDAISKAISGGSGRTEESDISNNSQGHLDFYGAETLAKAIDVPMPRQRSSGKGVGYRGETARHDSDGSLGQMFSISCGTRMSSGRTGSSGDVFARPGLMREQSDLDRESGASSPNYSPVVMTKPLEEEQKARSSRVGDDFMEKNVFTNSLQETKANDENYPFQSSLTAPGTNGNDFSIWPHHAIPGIDTGGFMNPKMKELMSPRHDPRPRIVETDYLPWSHDPPYPHPLSTEDVSSGRGGGGGGGWGGIFSSISPLQPYSVLLRALDYESKSCALHASAIILLLKPLVPESVIDTHRARAILQQHYRRLIGMSLFVEAALLRNMCYQGWPDGLPSWGENYDCIFSSAQQAGKAALFCSACRRPREVDPRAGAAAVWTCERCQSVMAPCCVCGHRKAERASHIPDEVVPSAGDVELDTWLSGWWYCPGCAHGGHASCLHLWHGASEADLLADASIKYSDGCCPSDGCGHACLPGRYRSEESTARSDELGRAAVDSWRGGMREERSRPGSRGGSRGGSRVGSRRSSPGPAGASGAASFERDRDGDRGVRSDVNEVPQSRAVGMAREALNRGSGGGILSSSPGRTLGSGDRERRKSVKFARQD
ncbi:hypothetical protein E4U55_005257 [Claviceps digitariae]|nr:hypothetical protein E4U55_005257 [Claviceps digitariae]